MAAACGYLIAVLAIMAARVSYPYEIEWMEGGVVDHVRRLAQGEPLYVSPSLAFIPFPYPPLFYALAAALSSMVGEGFIPLRIVSALSSLGILALIAAFVLRETGRRDAALIGAGLFAAMYQIGGAWFDVGRVDMLMLVLVLAGFFSARYASDRWCAPVTSIALSAAFFSKQSAAIIGAPLVLWLIVARPRQGIITALTTGTAAIAGTLILDALHDGWYRYYLFDLPSHYQLHPRRMVYFFTRDLVPTAIAAGLAVFALLTPQARRSLGFRLALATGLLAAAVVLRSNDGGYNNVLLPGFAAISVLAAVGYDSARRALAASASGQLLATWPAILLIIQFAILIYNPFETIPSAESRAAADRIVEHVRNTRGEVWIPYHGYLAAKAGKPPLAHWMAVADIYRFGRADLRAALEGEIAQALAARRFSLIVMSNSELSFPSLESTYVRQGPVTERPGVLMPVTGAQTGPESYYVPR